MRTPRSWRAGFAAVALLLASALSGASPASADSGAALTVTGDPVTGADSRVAAPLIGEGVWTDTLGGVGQARQSVYYRVHREHAGSTLRVSAATPIGVEDDEIAIALFDANGDSCATDTGYGSGTSESDAIVTASVAVPQSLDADDDRCAATGTYTVEVTHGTASSGRRDPISIELRVQEEPPVQSVQDLPATARTPAWRDPVLQGTGATAVKGGDSLNAAQVLAPGTYSSTIHTGQAQVFSVPVDFGQSLDAAARVAVSSTLAQKLAAGGSPTLAVTILSPSRQNAAGNSDFAASALDHTHGSSTIGQSSDGEVVYEFTDAVAYRNRFASGSALEAASERGRYLVIVSLLDRGDEPSQVTVPYVLGVAVRGAVQGAPDYTAAVTDVDHAQQGAAGFWGVLRQIAGVAVIVLGAAALAAGVVLLLIRRRRRT